ncbi:DUF3793 family protein [Candidatus Contubernalis alkaliaceticus]|uniref:DUF3793 family protein n=1 Tax=Candidatus Contubernalis alkaliaceticus TaxID=338645 RepID=UPI001F4C1FCD|nr:DUF3793 family protein [Candidatus Contubernalis alkalaceticus]UNC93083.1 DUF3793 family protein [Candidatus Contubernalis alkalaceticus]
MNSTYDTCANDYLTCLLGRIGATLAGVKPAELINVSSGDDAFGQWQHVKAAIKNFHDMDYIVIKVKKGRRQVLFYHGAALDQTLNSYSVQLFLKSLGYPENYTLEGYLDCLVEKLRGESFPHEIGVFLGYPLKDVKGFLGYSSLEMVQVKGWRIYGNREPSLETYHKFKEAKEEFQNLLILWGEGGNNKSIESDGFRESKRAL